MALFPADFVDFCTNFLKVKFIPNIFALENSHRIQTFRWQFHFRYSIGKCSLVFIRLVQHIGIDDSAFVWVTLFPNGHWNQVVRRYISIEEFMHILKQRVPPGTFEQFALLFSASRIISVPNELSVCASYVLGTVWKCNKSFTSGIIFHSIVKYVPWLGVVIRHEL